MHYAFVTRRWSNRSKHVNRTFQQCTAAQKQCRRAKLSNNNSKIFTNNSKNQTTIFTFTNGNSAKNTKKGHDPLLLYSWSRISPPTLAPPTALFLGCMWKILYGCCWTSASRQHCWNLCRPIRRKLYSVMNIDEQSGPRITVLTWQQPVVCKQGSNVVRELENDVSHNHAVRVE